MPEKYVFGRRVIGPCSSDGQTLKEDPSLHLPLSIWEPVAHLVLLPPTQKPLSVEPRDADADPPPERGEDCSVAQQSRLQAQLPERDARNRSTAARKKPLEELLS